MTLALDTIYQQIIHKSRYARYNYDTKSRETWDETVERYSNYFGFRDDVKDSITNLEVMPSMRAMMTAGPALDRDNMAGYNCSYTVPDSVDAIAEVMYILLCGTGLGASVESRYVNLLPVVSPRTGDGICIVFEDSKDGWYAGFKKFLSRSFAGDTVTWDLSKIRPEGARLRTFGGRASGPGPLDSLLLFVSELIEGARNRRLRTEEVADIICKIADVVVSGGVRRSALILLFDRDDEAMLRYKSGEWWVNAPYRRLANVSAVFEETPARVDFDYFWSALKDSGSGEPGIFNRQAAREKCKAIGRDPNYEWGTNPCSEIILRPKQLCNLSEVVIRERDTACDVAPKVIDAVVIGTLQSTLTDFHKLSPEWTKNAEEERLLGVSLTGVCDSAFFSTINGDLISALETQKSEARAANFLLSHHLGINPSAAITCVKPSGTVSQLVDSSSGIHPRFSRYYIRRIIMTKTDPLTQFLIGQGVQWAQSVYKENEVVFEFPMKAPDNAIVADDMTALEQLSLWSTYAEHWCEHKPSITVYIKEDEWDKVGEYVYNNFASISGIAFLPYSDHTYQQAPYEKITEDRYLELTKAYESVTIDWSLFIEDSDNTTASQELACVGGSCEIERV